MRIVFTSYVIIAIATCTTIVFVISLGPTSMTAFAVFTVWLLLPYGIMSAALALLKRRRIVFVPFYIVGALESVGGVLYLAYVIFGPPDAQGAFSVLATPILQAGTSVILLPIAFCVGGGSLQECDTPKRQARQEKSEGAGLFDVHKVSHGDSIDNKESCPSPAPFDSCADFATNIRLVAIFSISTATTRNFRSSWMAVSTIQVKVGTTTNHGHKK